MISLVLTSGDPSGIGPEIILKLLYSFLNPNTVLEKRLASLIRKKKLGLHLIGSVFVFQDLIQRKKMQNQLQKMFGRKGLISFFSSKDLTLSMSIDDNSSLTFPFSEVDNEGWTGKSKAKLNFAAGKISKACLDKSVFLVKRGLCQGIVNAPVNKEAISIIGEKFIGQTEYYAKIFGCPASMAFLSPCFDLVLMTTHVAIEDLPKQMTPEVIKQAIESALKLKKFRGDTNKLLVLGFNPHASENGQFGHQDKLIAEIIHELDREGRIVDGPLAADSAFTRVIKGDYRTVVACYHDQGLIPLKMLAKGSSVNVTLGLPYVRTSVDHGTAFDIANDFKADYNSLGYAIESAYDLCLNK